jgi:hypothetical protein
MRNSVVESILRMRKPKTNPKLKFRSGDDAWYGVSVKFIRDSYLKVHYQEFPEDEDEVLRLKDIKMEEEVRSRFRLLSKQLQDHHCIQVKEGMVICAYFSKNEGKYIGFLMPPWNRFISVNTFWWMVRNNVHVLSSFYGKLVHMQIKVPMFPVRTSAC